MLAIIITFTAVLDSVPGYISLWVFFLFLPFQLDEVKDTELKFQYLFPPVFTKNRLKREVKMRDSKLDGDTKYQCFLSLGGQVMDIP